MSRRDQERLASVYQYISEHPGSTTLHIENALGKPIAADWAVTELKKQGMITHLKNVQGKHGVDLRYATIRQAKDFKG